MLAPASADRLSRECSRSLSPFSDSSYYGGGDDDAKKTFVYVGGGSE